MHQDTELLLSACQAVQYYCELGTKYIQLIFEQGIMSRLREIESLSYALKEQILRIYSSIIRFSDLPIYCLMVLSPKIGGNYVENAIYYLYTTVTLSKQIIIGTDKHNYNSNKLASSLSITAARIDILSSLRVIVRLYPKYFKRLLMIYGDEIDIISILKEIFDLANYDVNVEVCL
jgi:hypothetical protein